MVSTAVTGQFRNYKREDGLMAQIPGSLITYLLFAIYVMHITKAGPL